MDVEYVKEELGLRIGVVGFDIVDVIVFEWVEEGLNVQYECVQDVCCGY